MGVREVVIGGNKLVIHELEDVYDSETGRALTGSWVWDSALVLAQWITTQAQLNNFEYSNKTVLELGAGTGLPGLTAARLGASRVILTDIESLVPVLEKNVEANGLKDRVEVSQLVWGTDELPSQLSELGQVDVVLMSDVFLDAEEMAAMAKTLTSVCGKGTKVWGASEVRPWTYDCLNELANEGFKIVELTSQLGDGLSSSEMTEGVSDEFAVFQLIPPVEDIEHSVEWSPIKASSDEINKE